MSDLIERYLQGPALVDIRLALDRKKNPDAPFRKPNLPEHFSLGWRITEEWCDVSLHPPGAMGAVAKALWHRFDAAYRVHIGGVHLMVSDEELPAAVCQALLHDYKQLKTAVVGVQKCAS